MISKRLLGALTLVVAVGMLAGCAAPTPGPTHSAHATPPPPTRTPAAASSPGSRVPVGCAGLLGEASWQALAGTAAKVERDEHTAPVDTTSIAQLQYGALSCGWSGLTSSGGSKPASELLVDVAPDAKAAFDSRFTAIMSDQSVNPHPTATQNVAGDRSGYWCATTLDALGGDRDIPDCDAEMLVSDYWVSINIDNLAGLTRAQVTAGLTSAMIEIAGKLTAAGSSPAKWVAPATSPPAFCTGSAATAQVRAILGNANLVEGPAPTRKIFASTIGLLGTWASCDWTGPPSHSVSVELLAGGAWAFPAINPVAHGEVSYAGKPYLPMSVSGTSSAKVACAGGVCDSYLAVGTTAVRITFEDAGAKNNARLAAFAKAIAAS